MTARACTRTPAVVPSVRNSSSERRSACALSSVAAVLLVLVPHAASAQPGPAASSTFEAEPLATRYDAPPGCPDADAFVRAMTARTTRARAARPDEKARVLAVSIAGGGGAFHGRLHIDDATSRSTAREVDGATCAEVVEALALVAALSVDPQASTAAPATASASAPPALAPPALAPPATPSAASAPAARDASAAAPPADAESHTRLALGAQVEGAALAGVVLSGRIFGEIAFGTNGRRLFAPSVRLSVARSLDRERMPAVGTATLRWTQAGLDGCPLRFVLGGGLAARPCVGISAGVLDADGTIAGAAKSRSRPWSAVSLLGRLGWEPSSAFAVEVEGGAVVPLFRESFFFEPAVPVYEAPGVALVGRAGLAVHFP